MDPVTQLREMGYIVEQFNEYHFRVEHCFEFWLPHGRWHDMDSGERGKKPLEQIPFFVSHRLEVKKVWL
jgi:hypothetical protein